MKTFHILLLTTFCVVPALPATVVQDNLPVAIRGTRGDRRQIDEKKRIEADLLRRKQERAADARLSPQYRTPRLDAASQRELAERRQVDESVRDRYAKFLRGGHTGIFKLFPDNGCTEKNLVRVAGACSGFVPDSSFYSFRTAEYGPSHGDIGLSGGRFVSRSFFTQSIMVSLGDTAIEEADAAHPALKRLVEFKPRLTPASAATAARLFAEGMYIGPYLFADSISAAAGPTFAIRKIEFKRSGEDVTFTTPDSGPAGNIEISLKASLNYSERKDTTYVFRVTGTDDDGAVTVLWKQVSRKDAPAIVFRKGDKFPDFDTAAGFPAK